MSKTYNGEIRNALYGLPNEVVQDAIRRAHRERAEAVSALVRKIFRRSDPEEETEAAANLDWKSLTSSGVQ